MTRTETYLRLADLCDREAIKARDAGERRQFDVLSRAIRAWAREAREEQAAAARKVPPPAPGAVRRPSAR